MQTKYGRRYPWDEFAESSRRKTIACVRGVDFDCEPASFMFMARRGFASRGVVRTLRVEGDTVFIEPREEDVQKEGKKDRADSKAPRGGKRRKGAVA